MRGAAIHSTRKGVIHHSIGGHFAYRQGKWKLMLCRASGGWSSPNENQAAKKKLLAGQLYDVESDPGESNNLFSAQPEIVSRLLADLKSDIQNGRSTAGPSSKNDVDVPGLEDHTLVQCDAKTESGNCDGHSREVGINSRRQDASRLIHAMLSGFDFNSWRLRCVLADVGAVGF